MGLANAVRDAAVERYGRSFVLTALKRQRQILNAEINAEKARRTECWQGY
jgi:hypothetical protein